MISKIIRSGSQWVKITRDGKAHKFTFCRGNAGVCVAHEEQSMSFEFVPTWADAKKHAQDRIAAYQ